MFGLLNLYVTNVKARHEFTEFVGATMFGTYNVISLVVLLNMLIAMMNNSYQLIAVSYLILSLCLFFHYMPNLFAWLRVFWDAEDCSPRFMTENSRDFYSLA